MHPLGALDLSSSAAPLGADGADFMRTAPWLAARALGRGSCCAVADRLGGLRDLHEMSI